MAVDKDRQAYVVETLEEAFTELMELDPNAFRTKFRKMAADPFAFYRGSACLFYRDIAEVDDPWVDERTRRVWVHGDLHAENFGTYMNSDGRLVFDVNDFDEAYLGHFTWDLLRFVASLSLMARRKAFPEDTVRNLAVGYLCSYIEQVHHYVDHDDDANDFALRLDNTEGPVFEVLTKARLASRTALLSATTTLSGAERTFRDMTGVRRLAAHEHSQVQSAFGAYLDTIPEDKRLDRDLFYKVKDVVGRTGFGIGSAGLTAYNLLLEGRNQALENDIVLSMKQGAVPAISRYVADERADTYFEHQGHRTVISQRALQAHTDPFLGWTALGDTGYLLDEISPYESDLAWDDLTEPDLVEPVLRDLGRATAKVHCASDEDSDEGLVEFQIEEAIAEALDGDREGFVRDICDRGLDYAERARADHELFVDAFREGRIGGLSST